MILRGPSRPDFLLQETLPDILQKTVNQHPEKTAIEFGKKRITYRELQSHAVAIGDALSALGAGPGEIVGLLLPRGADLLTAQAGIAACGAGWLPFDADIPLERASVCLASAQACGVVTLKSWAEKLCSLPVPVWSIEDLLAEETPRLPSRRPAPHDAAYVIYTSGSTGTPKGIAISQANICHFLRSENHVLGIHSQDIVYQGFSAAFDMSFEEVWISYLVGATLWVAPQEMIADPDAITDALAAHEITVLHAVPTLAALIERFPPCLRLLNLGGEACPDALAQRLAGKGRRVFNTYGPTETTVTASVAELMPGQPVTIGSPLPNYGMLVLDSERRPLPVGEVGEIAVFGPGVSLGYLHLPDLTRARFIPNPVAEHPSEERLYLTGDLGKVTPDAQVHCLGRVDHQVKIRGFRIELDEVAAAIARQPGVGTAAAIVRSLYGADEIVAFAVLSGEREDAPNEDSLRGALSGELPSYMVPARIQLLEEMPRLASGKIDLATLRTIPLSRELEAGSEAPSHTPATPSEKALWKALGSLFPGRNFHPDQDFFCDLGGHSLLAARLVSLLRKDPSYSGTGVQHIYKNRTLEAIARALGQLHATAPTNVTAHPPTGKWRHFLCGTAQLACLPFIILLDILLWLAPFFTYHSLTGSKSDSVPVAMALAIAVFLATAIVSFPLTIALRKILVGDIKAGDYPLWGVTYFRWWLGSQLSKACAIHLISGTPWKAFHLRLLGAKIGRRTMLNSLTVAVPELLEIGDDVCIGTFVNIENARVEGGRFIVGSVKIGADAAIDSYAVLENDTALGEGAWLLGQSSLSHGRCIPAGETWSGAPAQKVQAPMPLPQPAPKLGLLQRVWHLAYYAMGGGFVALLFFVPTFPSFVLMDWIDGQTVDLFDSTLTWWQAFPFFFCMALPAAMVFVTLTALLAGTLRKLFPRIEAGTFPLHGAIYRRKWLLSTILDTSLQVLHGLYASIFAASWLRLLGAKVGKEAEVSTAEGVIPSLLQLGDGSFIADGALLGDEEQRRGWMHLRGTIIGNRSFVGNSAYVPDGAVFPDDMLLGVQSAAPLNEEMIAGQTWMGSPPMLLPARETIETPDASLTFHPALWRKITRGTIEAVRIVLPLAFMIAAGYVIVYRVMDFVEEGDWVGSLTEALLCGVIYSLGSFLFVWALKWIAIGRYSSRKAPMWTPFVWLSEAVTVAHESLSVPALLDHLRGTPFLPWALRLMGANIGKGVWLNTTDLTEFDCVRIGDHAELNAHCGPQTHLFEDRVMRVGDVHIGEGATLGVRAIVLYDASVGDFCRLGALTLVAKGEHLPSHTRWEGSPATSG
jgi:non-ribosomal peptide synthetase-like protein